MKGKYPGILKHARYGSEARKLFADAEKMLDEIISGKLLQARAVLGFFPANSVGFDDIEVYPDDDRRRPLAVIHTLRQQMPKTNRQANLALADYVAPAESGVKDYIGAFAVTAGIGTEAAVQHYRQANDDYRAILLKALADRLAEAFAELLHQRTRREFWGYAPDENLSNEALIKEKYSGIRPAPGYPACPDHTEKKTLFDLLEVSESTGIRLTENFAMYPAATVSGYYFSHPGARYFGTGKIGKDQVIDYARRKGMDVKTAEKWLSPVLAY